MVSLNRVGCFDDEMVAKSRVKKRASQPSNSRTARSDCQHPAPIEDLGVSELLHASDKLVKLIVSRSVNDTGQHPRSKPNESARKA